MRLLYFDNNYEIRITDFIHQVPEYAILSHAWSDFTEEVTLRDMMEDKAVHKQGYQKILFCGARAAKDGLRYFWIDTCCINNMSSVEVLEAVDSMTRWYQNAAQCYVYPDNISTNTSPINMSFQRSKWLARAKILQAFTNLTLPWTELSMEALNYTLVTSVKALSKAPVSGFSIEERISWIKDHKLRREEDESYGLRISDTHLPIIYGEEKEDTYRQLWMKMHKFKNSALYTAWAAESEGSLHRTSGLGQIRLLNLTQFGVPAISELDSDNESEFADIFSDGGMSSSTALTAILNPVQTIGIREVSRALLSDHDWMTMHFELLNCIEPRGLGLHLLSLLYFHGENIFDNAFEIQATKSAPEERALSPRTRLEMKDLENWLSTCQTGGNMASREPDLVNLKESVEEIFDEDESDVELDEGLSFPNIDRVREFLLHSEAFQTHVEEMRTWLKMDGSKRKDAGRLTGKDADHLDVEDLTEETLDIPTIPEEPQRQMDGNGKREVEDEVEVDTEHLNVEDINEMLDSPTFIKELQRQEDKDGKRKAEDLTEVDTRHLDIPSSAREPPTDPTTTETCQQQADQEDDPSVETDTQPQHDSGQHNSAREPQARPRSPPPHQAPSVRDLISALLEFWGPSFFFHDIIDLFLPSVPPGYRRLRWRCVSHHSPLSPARLRSPRLLTVRSHATLSFGATFPLGMKLLSSS
jgi:hypothetical protein